LFCTQVSLNSFDSSKDRLVISNFFKERIRDSGIPERCSFLKGAQIYARFFKSVCAFLKKIIWKSILPNAPLNAFSFNGGANVIAVF
jgi:hypothetical protein